MRATGDRGRPTTVAPHGVGVFTLGFGDARYRQMARNLSLSLALHSPDLPRAVVTDRPDEMERWYDVVVPHPPPEHGSGFARKLMLDSYSPFERTLFLDSDCLAVRDVAECTTLLAGTPFAACGRESRQGEWFGAQIEAVLTALGGDAPLGLFNGGLYYWERGVKSSDVFATARRLASRYEELGFRPMKGRPGALTDEPLISLAMRENGVAVVDDTGSTMRTPLGIEGPLDVDVLAGRCSFVKSRRRVEPAVVHFCGDWAEKSEYRREVVKLRLARAVPLPRPLVSHVLDALVHVARLVRRPGRLLSRSRHP